MFYPASEADLDSQEALPLLFHSPEAASRLSFSTDSHFFAIPDYLLQFQVLGTSAGPIIDVIAGSASSGAGDPSFTMVAWFHALTRWRWPGGRFSPQGF